jgi:hypothetical protein
VFLLQAPKPAVKPLNHRTGAARKQSLLEYLSLSVQLS